MSLSQELWPKKKRISSNSKGKANELKLANVLTDWAGVKFFRTPGSGSFSNKAKNLVCDIMAEGCSFAIETKHYAKISQKDIEKIWKKAKTEHPNPLLFIRTNGMRGWLVYSEVDLKIPNVPRGTLYEYKSVDFFKLDYNEVNETATK